MRSAQKSTSHKFWWRFLLIFLTIISLLAGSFPPPKTVLALDSFSDDFENGLGNWQADSTSITTVSPPVGAKNGSKVLQMAYNGGDGITVEKNFSTPQAQGVLSIWFYDSGPDTPAGSVILVSDNNPDTTQRQVVMLGVNPSTPGYYYYRATRNQPNLGMSSRVSRSQGWHKFEIVVTPAGSYGRIDDNSLAWIPANGEATSLNRNLTSFTKIQIGATWGQAGNYWWDNLQLQNLPAAPVPDDFENGLGNWEKSIATDYNNGVAIVSPPVGAQSGSRALQLTYNGGESVVATQLFASPQQGIVSAWFYDSGPDTPAGSVILVSDSNPDTTQRQVVVLGVNPSTPGYYYYRATRNQPNLGMSSRVSRSQGWHQFEIVVTPTGSYGRIDDNALNWLPSSGEVTSVNRNLTAFTKIQIGATWNQVGNYWWDNLQLQNLPAAPVPDDFENGLGNWEKSIATDYNNGVAIVSPPVGAQSGSRALQLTYNGGESVVATQLFASPQQGIVSAWFYDPGPSTPGGTVVLVNNEIDNQIVMLGVQPSVGDYYYYRAAINPGGVGMNSLVPRSQGWHKFEIVVTPKGAYGKIDDISLSFLPNTANNQATAVNPNLTSFTKIRIAATWGITGTYLWDNLQIKPLPSIPGDILSREKYFLEKFLAISPNYQGWSNPVDEGRIKGIRASTLAYLKQNTDEAKSLILDIANNYPLWIREAADSGEWKGRQEDGSATPADYWTGTFVSSSMGLAAWMLWPELETTTKLKVKEALFAQAEKYLDLEPRSTFDIPGQAVGFDPNNAAVEENAAIADTLLLVAQMFPQDPGASAFEAQGKKFAFHTLTRRGLDESYGGRVTAIVDESYLVSEHSLYPNLTYSLMGGVGMLGSAARYYLGVGKEIPRYELGHNISQVFEAHTNPTYLNPGIYRGNFTKPGAYTLEELGGKDDWNVDATYLNSGFAYYAYLTGNKNALLNLQEFELYITPDFLSFPQEAEVYFPGCSNNYKADPSYGFNKPVDPRCRASYKNPDFYYTSSGRYLINSVNTWSHLVAAMLYDNSLTLPSTISTSAGTTPNCSSVYLKTPSTSQGRVEVFKRKLWESPSPIWECDNAQIPSGRQGPSLKITSFSPITNGEAYSRLIPVRAGKDYILSYWVKTADLEGVNVGRVAISGYNQSAQEANEINENRIQTQQVADLLNSGDPLTGTWDWQERSFLFTPPPGTAYVRVRAGVGQAQGAVWFANLELKEATGFNFFLNSITPREGQILENTPFGLSVVTTLEGSRPWASQGVYLRVFEQSQGICLRVGESQTSCNNNSNLLRNTWQGRQDFTVNFPGLARGIYTLTVQTIVRRQFLIFSWDDVRKSTTFNFGVPLLSSALPQNLLSNPGFETGNVSPWVGEKASLTLVDGNSSPADIHSGRWAARVILGSQSAFYSIDNFPGEVPNPRVGETYYGTVWVKGGGNSLGKGVRLVIREHDNATPQYRRLESPGSLVPLTDSWQQLSISHTITNTGMTNLDILVTQEGASGGESFLVDDFFLSRVSSQNLLSNPGFESGQTSPWTSWQGILARSNDKHSGSWATLVSYDYQPNRPGFLPGAYSIDNFPGETDNPQIGQVYYATAWVKGVGTSVGKPVKLSIREHDFVRVNDVPGEFVTLENGWRQISAYYKVTNIGMTKLDVYVLQVDAVVGDTFLTDDIALYRF